MIVFDFKDRFNRQGFEICNPVMHYDRIKLPVRFFLDGYISWWTPRVSIIYENKDGPSSTDIHGEWMEYIVKGKVVSKFEFLLYESDVR